MDDLFRRMREQQEALRRAVDGPLDYIRENERTVAELQRIARGIDPSVVDAARYSRELHDFTRQFHQLVDMRAEIFDHLRERAVVAEMQQFMELSRVVSVEHERLREPLSDFAKQVAELSNYNALTAAFAATIDIKRAGELIGAGIGEQRLIAQTTTELSLRHTALIASVAEADGRLASQPVLVTELTTVDLFVHTGAVRSITPHEAMAEDDNEQSSSLLINVEQKTVAFLEQTLPQLKPAFLSQFRGARERARSRGDDFWTQGGSSLRKLIKGVLHTVAPDDQVLPWAIRNKKELDRVGRPTRATKIEWLCEPVQNGDYRAYMRSELESALALVKLIDNTQHVDDFGEFETRYDWMVVRVEVAVEQMLQLWKLRRG
jgi:hypothetical protein